jgi:hypothetical protein
LRALAPRGDISTELSYRSQRSRDSTETISNVIGGEAGREWHSGACFWIDSDPFSAIISVRMECKRFACLTLAFSKKLANLKASVALHYAHYNFVRVHRTLRCTPAMAAGVSNRLWSVEEVIAEALNGSNEHLARVS